MSLFDWDTVKDNLAKGGMTVLETVRESFRDRIDEEADVAFAEGIERGIRNTVAALYDADVDDQKIIDLLNKHWGIPSGDAKSRLLCEKMEAACRELESHLELQGYSQKKIREIMTSNYVRPELRHNPELLKLWRNPEKLLKAVESARNIRKPT